MFLFYISLLDPYGNFRSVIVIRRDGSYFVNGIHAGNYDIEHFFIDNFYKLVEDKSDEALVSFVKWLEKFSQSEKVEFVVSISADPDAVSEEIKQFII